MKHKKLITKKVAIIGIGCVGCLAADTLARNHIGYLTLVDKDVFEPGNINRQLYANSETVGMKKVYVAKEQIRRINPFIEVETIDAYFSEENADDILLYNCKPKYDIVLQCIDKMNSRIELHRACEKYQIPIITMSGQPPFRGLVSTFLPGSPSYEEFFNLPTKGMRGKELEEIAEKCKIKRAKKAVENGALKEWFNDFVAGKAPWATTVDRVYTIGTFQIAEALRYLRNENLFAVAPRAYVIDLNGLDEFGFPQDFVRILDPANGKNWDYRLF